jgi:hypothetical protein
MLGPSSVTEEGNLGANPAKRVRLGQSLSIHAASDGPPQRGNQLRRSLIMVATTSFDPLIAHTRFFGLLELARTIIIPGYSKPRADVPLDSQ